MKIPAPEQFEDAFDNPVWTDVARSICARHLPAHDVLRRAEHGENIVFLVDDTYIIKIYLPQKNGFAREKAAIEFVGGKTRLAVADIIAAGEIEGYNYLITTQIEGGLMTRDTWLKLDRDVQIGLLTDLAAGLREVHSLPSAAINFDWNAFIDNQIRTVIDRQTREGGNPEWTKSLPRYIEDNLGLLPEVLDPVFMHGDVHFGNLRIAKPDGRWRITGIFDFADSLKGFHEYEFIAIGVLMVQGQGELQREFFRAYGYADDAINETFRRRMMMLTILYEHSSLRRYAERLSPVAKELTLDDLERAIWNFV